MAFAAVAYTVGYTPKLGPRLIVAIRTPDAKVYTPKNMREACLATGPASKIMHYMGAALEAADTINKAGLGYFPYAIGAKGQNCHSVMAELVERMTGRALGQKDMGFFTPGIDTDLEKFIPGLTRIKTDFQKPLSQIFKGLNLGDLAKTLRIAGKNARENLTDASIQSLKLIS